MAVTTAPPDAGGLRGLADRLVAYDDRKPFARSDATIARYDLVRLARSLAAR